MTTTDTPHSGADRQSAHSTGPDPLDRRAAAVAPAGSSAEPPVPADDLAAPTGPPDGPDGPDGHGVPDRDGEGLQISHTPAEGTLLTGSRRGDGVYDVLRSVSALRWRWSRNIGDDGAFYVPRSRDKTVPDRYGIRRTAEALTEAGYTVHIHTGRETRPVEDREAERADRNEHRVERLQARTGKLAAESEARFAAADRISEHIPMGQPILVGHHSERRHRKALEKIDRNMGAGAQAARDSRDAARQADGAEAGQRLHLSGPRTMRRIDELEAERRRIRRGLDGHSRTIYTGYPPEVTPPATGTHREDLTALLADVDAQLVHWRKHLQALRDSGEYRVWGPGDFERGDYVGCRFGWAKVLRVNRKSLTIPHPEPRLAEADYTAKVPYDDVQRKQTAAEHAAAQHAAARQPDGEQSDAGVAQDQTGEGAR